MNHVCMSATADYAESMTVAAASWLRCGVTPHCALVSCPRDTAAETGALHRAASRLQAWGVATWQLPVFEASGFVREPAAPIPGAQVLGGGAEWLRHVGRVAAGKLARFYVAAQFNVHDQSMICLSDADMVMLRPHPALFEPREMAMVSWGVDLYAGTRWFPRWPICYLAAQTIHWQNVCQHIPVALVCGAEPNGNFSDELILKAILPDYGIAIAGIERRDSAGRCAGRIERRAEAWDGADWATAIDAHIPRENWGWTPERLARVHPDIDWGAGA